MWPSRSVTTRAACLAMSCSWVTITIVWPWRCRSANTPISSALVAESRFPVGSSASRMLGSFTSARAIATRCRCPPDSSFGLCAMRSPSPTRSSARPARRTGGGARQQVEGLEHEPDLLEGLEHEPDLLVADARQLVVGQVAHFQAVEPVLARGGGVEAADEVHERRLPRSRRPHHRHVLVLADLEAHAAQRVHDLAAHVVVAGELVREDHDVRLWRVAGAELLEAGHAYFFFLAVSAACFIGRTRALSL